MLISRGINALKLANRLRTNNVQVASSRNSAHWNYRVAGPPPPKYIIWWAEGVGGFAWWWVLWHCWTEPGHILGEFDYPDARKWTDEELGIPPIDD